MREAQRLCDASPPPPRGAACRQAGGLGASRLPACRGRPLGGKGARTVADASCTRATAAGKVLSGIGAPHPPPSVLAYARICIHAFVMDVCCSASCFVGDAACTTFVSLRPFMLSVVHDPQDASTSIDGVPIMIIHVQRAIYRPPPPVPRPPTFEWTRLPCSAAFLHVVRRMATPLTHMTCDILNFSTIGHYLPLPMGLPCR